jgi:hypothetical protein
MHLISDSSQEQYMPASSDRFVKFTHIAQMPPTFSSVATHPNKSHQQEDTWQPSMT